MNVNVMVELEIILSVFEICQSFSGYKSAHAYKCTRVVQSQTFRVIKNGDDLWLLMETNGIGKRDSVLSKIMKS